MRCSATWARRRPQEITAGQAARILERVTPAGAVAQARCELAAVPHRHPPSRCPAARHQQEAGRGGQSRTRPDRHLRRRPGHRRHGDRGRAPGVPVPQPEPLRRLQRHRPGRGVLRRPEGLPAVAARQPQAQPCDPHGRGHPDPAQAQPGPQTPDQRRLRAAPSDRPGTLGRMGRGHTACQGAAAAPRAPDSHSRACHHHTPVTTADPAPIQPNRAFQRRAAHSAVTSKKPHKTT